MRRRTNKSTKVPNVKLRPAEKGAYAAILEESCWAQETQPDSDDKASFDRCPRPLKGVCICVTGVHDKPTLFKQAVELGATCTPAFTDRVTHLVALDHGGAKYGCALERKIPIVKPSWITENYKIWLRGDDFDFNESVDAHRLPVFSGIVVCPSGITDITTRTKISKIVTAHQGQYLKNLERPVRVTHLLCSGDEETDKMKYAEKFNSRGEAKIHLVWEEWFWDSLEFGGRFDETKYQVRLPRPARKSFHGPGSSSPPPPSSEVPSQHDECPSPSSTPYVPRKSQPLQKDNPEDPEDEPAFVNVLPAVTLQLWGSLLERRGYEVADGEVILSPSKAKKDGTERKNVEQPPPQSPVEEMQFGAARSVISSFRRVNSFAPVVSAKESIGRQQPFRRSATATAAFNNPAASTSVVPAAAPVAGSRNAVTENAVAGPSTVPPTQIFAGMKIRALGEAKGPTVRTAIEQHGGTWSVDEDDDVDFIIVRLVSGSKFFRLEEDEHVKSKYRTECWLEQCIYADRICAPEEQISSVPLHIQIPVFGAEKVVMAISGFDQSEACGLKRLFRALGITFAPTFSRKSTHLLCPSATGQKFDKAREWGIPVVDREWLIAISASADIPEARNYLVPGSIVPLIEMDVDMEAGRVVRKDVKGKGKAVDPDHLRITTNVADNEAMDVSADNNLQDITNDEPRRHASPKKLKKAQPLERQATTIVTDELPAGNTSFGAPYLLRVSPSINISSSSGSVAASLTSPAQIPQQDSFTYSSSRQVESALNPSASHSNLLRRTSTLQDIGPRQGERIPSSASPSPMKIERTNSRGSASPVKIDMEAAKALQESIASLLGKRPSADGDDVEMVEIEPKGGRRTRPKRSKVQSSRQSSEADLRAAAEADAAVAVTSSPSAGRGSGKRTKALRAGVATRTKSTPGSLNGDSATNVLLGAAVPASASASAADQGKSQQESQGDEASSISVRVTYEDPTQKEEKLKLMELLKNQSALAIASGMGGEEDSLSAVTISTRMSNLDSRRPRRTSSRIAQG